MADKTFANGIIYKEPSDKAPDFVIGGLSIKKSEFIPFLDSQIGDWVNLKINLSKGGKPDRTDSKPETKQKEIDPPEDNLDLPF